MMTFFHHLNLIAYTSLSLSLSLSHSYIGLGSLSLTVVQVWVLSHSCAGLGSLSHSCAGLGTGTAQPIRWARVWSVQLFFLCETCQLRRPEEEEEEEKATLSSAAQVGCNQQPCCSVSLLSPGRLRGRASNTPLSHAARAIPPQRKEETDPSMFIRNCVFPPLHVAEITEATSSLCAGGKCFLIPCFSCVSSAKLQRTLCLAFWRTPLCPVIDVHACTFTSVLVLGF